ncbi:hypothetical protein T484DRAFT_1796441 [Baffinella frigidus]|nr:hypothetical protein T484DRAFT_1796441 [Cryptophyta sp. CCMP2293]
MARTARGFSCPDEGTAVLSFNHFGAPRTVYALPPEHRTRFELLVEALAPASDPTGSPGNSESEVFS